MRVSESSGKLKPLLLLGYQLDTQRRSGADFCNTICQKATSGFAAISLGTITHNSVAPIGRSFCFRSIGSPFAETFEKIDSPGDSRCA
jgi:hypothetical protein